MSYPKISSSFPDATSAAHVLETLRHDGSSAALKLLETYDISSDCSLLQELFLRLNNLNSPRIILDGIWFSRAYGGITRVWSQILATWSLPGLISPKSPVCIIDRDSHLSITDHFDSIPSIAADPLDSSDILRASDQNTSLISSFGADCFISSWITTSSTSDPACPESVLVHDCMPERFRSIDPLIPQLRRRWLHGASRLLAVSRDTSDDLANICMLSRKNVNWVHPAPDPLFSLFHTYDNKLALWKKIS